MSFKSVINSDPSSTLFPFSDAIISLSLSQDQQQKVNNFPTIDRAHVTRGAGGGRDNPAHPRGANTNMAGLGRFFSVQFRRQFCISPGPKKLSPLAALRRKTGYPLSKCKEALVRHGNDLETAEKWLREQAQREGWAKSDQGRPTQEGVIATLVWGNTATMMEVS